MAAASEAAASPTLFAIVPMPRPADKNSTVAIAPNATADAEKA